MLDARDHEDISSFSPSSDDCDSVVNVERTGARTGFRNDGRWDDASVVTSHRFSNTIRALCDKYEREVASSALPDEHKDVILADLRKMAEVYSGDRTWDVYPRNISEIERARRHRSNRIARYGTD